MLSFVSCCGLEQIFRGQYHRILYMSLQQRSFVPTTGYSWCFTEKITTKPCFSPTPRTICGAFAKSFPTMLASILFAYYTRTCLRITILLSMASFHALQPSHILHQTPSCLYNYSELQLIKFCLVQAFAYHNERLSPCIRDTLLTYIIYPPSSNPLFF